MNTMNNQILNDKSELVSLHVENAVNYIMNNKVNSEASLKLHAIINKLKKLDKEELDKLFAASSMGEFHNSFDGKCIMFLSDRYAKRYKDKNEYMFSFNSKLEKLMFECYDFTMSHIDIKMIIKYLSKGHAGREFLCSSLQASRY